MRSLSRAKLPLLLAFIALAAGCSRQLPPPTEARTEATSRSKPDGGPSAEAASTPAQTLALADHLYESRLGASRGQFDEDRQIAALQQEVLLYTQFLERAQGQPELEPAVRKSRERIADANATIEFLRKQLRGDGAEPPPAQTE
jgi:hypothetical protein